jgi:hypothetical protein
MTNFRFERVYLSERSDKVKILTLLLVVIAVVVPAEATGDIACLIMLQETTRIGSWLHDPAGIRYLVVDALVDQGICDVLQVLTFAEEANLIFLRWTPADVNEERLKEQIRRRILQEHVEEADIDHAFRKALGIFEELEGFPKRIVVLLSDGEFTPGSAERLFQKTLPEFIKRGIRVYAFRFYFLERPTLKDIAEATGGVYWPGNVAILQAALDRIASDLKVQGQESPPLGEFIDFIVADIAMKVFMEEIYWDDVPVRLGVSLTYKGQPLSGAGVEVTLGEDRGKLWIEGIYTVVGGESHPMHYSGRRYTVSLSLVPGVYPITLLAKGRLRRGVEEEPFKIEAHRTVFVKQKPMVALKGAEGTYVYVRNQPIELKVYLIKGDPTDLTRTPKVGVIPPRPGGAPLFLTPVPKGAGEWVISYRPVATGSYTFIIAEGEGYRVAPNSDIKVQVTPPKLQVPTKVSIQGQGCLTVRATLFPPDTAMLAVMADELEANKAQLHLSPEKGEAKLCLKMDFPLLEQLRRKGFTTQVHLKDLTGTFGNRTWGIAVEVIPSFPTAPLIGAALLGLIVAVPVGVVIHRRRRSLKEHSVEQLVGRGFSFPKPKGDDVLEIAVGRAPEGTHKITIPREDIAETQLIITVQNGISKLIPKSQLKTYVNGAAVLVETELQDESIIEFGSESSCSLLFTDKEQEVCIQILKIQGR